MANLIITVISIALVAVAALMGAYYGGAAFLSGGAKANANTLLNQAEQVTSALLMRNFEGQGWALSTDLSELATNGRYLSAIPALDPRYMDSTQYCSGAANFFLSADQLDDCTDMTFFGTTKFILAEFANNNVGYKTCLEIAKIADGPSGLPLLQAGNIAYDINFATVLGTKRFGCLATSGTQPTGPNDDTLFFVMRFRS